MSKRDSRSAAGAAPPDSLETALRLLARRPHSTAELRRKLGQRGCPAGAVEEALRRLSQLGYLDDQAFARALVARRSSTRGAALISAELASRGVSREVAREVLGGLSREDQLAAARRAALASGGDHPGRLAGRLQRRGFPVAVVLEILGDLEDWPQRRPGGSLAAGDR